MKKFLTLPLSLLAAQLLAQPSSPIDSLKSSELQPITIVGSKPLSSSGQYISNEKLQMLNQTNVNNVLRSVPGVIIRDEEGFGLRPNIGLRGTAVGRSSKVTLMEDGILIAPAPYADPAAYYFPTFARMNAIEVLKGSSQIKYGPYTVGGAINLLSTPIPDAFKGEALLSYGSFGTNQQKIWLGDSHKNIDYVFEVNRWASNGFKQLDNKGNTGFERRDVMGKVRWHTSASAKIPQSVMLKFAAMSELGNESYLGLSYNDYLANPYKRYAATQKDFFDLKHNHVFLNHTILPAKGLSFSTTAYYTYTYRDWARVNTIEGKSLNSILADPTTNQAAYDIMTGKADGNIEYRSAARAFYAKGIQTNGEYHFRTGKIEHKVSVGARYHIDNADRYNTKSGYVMQNGTMILNKVGIKGDAENQIRSAQSFAAFLNYDFAINKLHITPGVRYENIHLEIKNYGTADNARLGTALKEATNQLSVILPGVGVRYDFNYAMQAFASIHKGFSPPGMPSVSSTTGQAKPETSTNYELGYRLNNRGWKIEAVGFYNNYDNILGSDNISGGGMGTGDMFNAGHAMIAGAELTMGYSIPIAVAKELPIEVTYTYTQAKFQENFKNGGGDWGTGDIKKGDNIPFINPHLLTASISYVSNRFNTTLQARYIGESRIKPGQDAIVLPAENVAYGTVNAMPSNIIIDLSANYKMCSNLTLFTTVNNITNSKVPVSNLPQGYRPNMPISFNIGIKAKF